MNRHSPAGTSPTLDPEDWTELRSLGHAMVDDALDHLAAVREQPAWRPVPDDVRERLSGPVPHRGIGARATYREYLRDVRPYPTGNTHPRFWGWVMGSGTTLGALADFLAAMLNPNVSGLASAAVLVEQQVLDWMCELFGYPDGASGLLVSGGSMANHLGIAVGMHARAEHDLKQDGLAAAPRPMVMYASSETHYSVTKAAQLLGIGARGVRSIPVDDAYRIDLQALRQAIRRDREAGLHPFAVVGNAGTVNTGAFDDLTALADIGEQEGLWLHVDGAFGALTALVPELRALSRGMERADSIAFDLHKWMHVPIEAACILIRDGEQHTHPFTAPASYLATLDRGVARIEAPLSSRGLQLTRGFRALKVWMSLKADGVDAYARSIAHNVEQARYLADRVEAEASLELLAPVPSNVVCFRYLPAGEDVEIDELNREIVMQLQERGIAVPSQTVLEGQFAIRVAITNHRSRRDDFDRLVDAVLEIGRAQEAAGR